MYPNATAKGGKFDCSVMSLSVLLDYRPEDNKEHSFEVRSNDLARYGEPVSCKLSELNIKGIGNSISLLQLECSTQLQAGRSLFEVDATATPTI